jgi:hypothetical protein
MIMMMMMMTPPSTALTTNGSLSQGAGSFDSREWGRAYEFSSEDVTVSEDFHGWSYLLLPEELCEDDGKPSLKKMPVGLPTLRV